MKLTLRPYQQECVDVIDSTDSGSGLVAMATGLGKTVVFSSIKRKGRVLILSHRDELVHQPQKYYDCSFGVEQAFEHSNGEEVVSASVQSLVKRLNRFSPNDFDTIITDEAHHAVAPTYQKIYDYFNPRLHIGFSATPNRGDKVRLDKVFDKIIFQRDLHWGIRNNYLSDINCLRIDIGYDISKVKKQMGDFNINQLENAMNLESQNKAIAEAYEKYAVGQTLIFATSVKHAENIANEISGAVVVSAETKNRQEIIEAFTRRQIPCLVNCMIFSEGTDMPLIETIIIARPTQNTSLYAQMVGRGLRLCAGKASLTLMDCVGVSGKLNICTAPTLLGIDVDNIPQKSKNKITGLLTEIPEKVNTLFDVPDVWKVNAHLVELFAKEECIDLHNINWFMHCDGKFTCAVRRDIKLVIMPLNELNKTHLYLYLDKMIQCFNEISMQEALDAAYEILCHDCENERNLWDLSYASIWGRCQATVKQKKYISSLLAAKKYIDSDGFDVSKLTKFEAGLIINKLTTG